MKSTTLRVLMLLLVIAATFTSTACRVRQTKEGELPKVDVEVEGGKLPEYDVDAADIDINKKEITVTVPDIDIEPPRDGDQDPPSEDQEPPQKQ